MNSTYIFSGAIIRALKNQKILKKCPKSQSPFCLICMEPVFSYSRIRDEPGRRDDLEEELRRLSADQSLSPGAFFKANAYLGKLGEEVQ